MKNLFFIVFIVSIAFLGCKKDSPAPVTYNADATISSVKTTFTDVEFIDITMNQSTSYSIQNLGTESETNAITINLANPIVGENAFSDVTYMTVKIGTKTYTSNVGKIVLSKKDASLMSGTYSGTFNNATESDVQISGNFSAKVMTLNIGK